MAERYPFETIEPKWQAFWEAQKTFRAVDLDRQRRKFYVLDMFPYPSGAGLHVGHPEGYTATDIVARYRRMRGDNVLHPMGWDAFGLPAEQYAIETGTHPAKTTRQNIEVFRRQIKRLGFSYDWDREIDTTDPGYVKWTQWIFLKLFEQGLAYMAQAPVWWCADCGVVLANEEIIDGRCERKGHPVTRRPMRQWMLKITAYAERLLADLEGLDWPEHIKEMQRHWIGKREGAEVWFAVDLREGTIPEAVVDQTRVRRRNGAIEFKIFTTRPDTLFGVTYMVLSPEHPLTPSLAAEGRRDVVERYRQAAAHKSELERTELAKEKTGVLTGACAINPVNGSRIPIWIADYVLASYGTGAIMAVPAHDQRDLEFALRYGLDVKIVIVPEDRSLELIGMTEAYLEPGRMHDSGPFTGLASEEVKGTIIQWLSHRGLGRVAVNYRLRDWLFSRQRYWGEPIPVVHCKSCGTVPLPESELPLGLPPVEDFKPDIFVPVPEETVQTSTTDVLHVFEAPLKRATVKHPVTGTESYWKDTICRKCNGPAERETNTMPQWAGSCWYYLCYLDPRNPERAWDPEKERYWMPVDLYVGGAEHAVLHLLYARFWHKVLFDLKLVSTPEPFQKLVNQGLILGEDGEKMSKSRGNVVNPDDVIAQHGADAFRLHEMFMGPLEAVKPWNTRSIEGVDRFLNRVWRLIAGADPSTRAPAKTWGTSLGMSPATPQGVVLSERSESKDDSSGAPQASPELHGVRAPVQELPVEGECKRLVHATIQSVTEDLEGLRFNTAISSLMVLLNALEDVRPLPRAAVETFILLLSPLAPHLSEELWQRLGHPESVAYAPWPRFDPQALVQQEILWVVQVEGKVRARMTLSAQASEDELRQAVLADERIKRCVGGRPIKQFIVVPKRLVNIAL